METWRHGDGDMENMGKWRHGDMETWTWRYGDIETWTWRHGHVDTWTHGDMDKYMDMETRN